MLISLPLLRNLSPKIFLSICNIPKDLAKEPLKILTILYLRVGFSFSLLLILFVQIVLFVVVLFWSYLECVLFNRRWGSDDGIVHSVLKCTQT